MPLTIGLSGLAPSSTVKLAAEMTARDGTVWRSHAVFRADRAGKWTSVARGLWRGRTRLVADGAGVVDGTGTVGATAASNRLRDPVNIQFSATTETGTSIRTTVDRLLAGPGVTYRPLEPGSPLQGRVVVAGGAGPSAGRHRTRRVGGGPDHDGRRSTPPMALRPLALAYFRAPGLPRSLVNIPLEYVDVAIDDALDTMRPPKDFVAVAGTSRGGELALLVGATFPKVRAVVGIMASGLVMGAFGDPGPNVSTPSAAWTLAKKPVPDLFAGNPRVDWTDSKQEVSLGAGLSRGDEGCPLRRARHDPSRTYPRSRPSGHWQRRPVGTAVRVG